MGKQLFKTDKNRHKKRVASVDISLFINFVRHDTVELKRNTYEH